MNQSMVQKGLGVVLLLAVVVSLAFAAPEQNQRRQQPQRMGGGQFGGFGGGRGMEGFDFSTMFNPEAMQKRIMDYYKDQLGATDEEWTVLEPRVSKVVELTQQTNAVAGMMRTAMRGAMQRFRQRQGAQDQEEETEEQSTVEKASMELQETIDKEAPSAAEIKAKITALRGAKEKAKQELLQAQKELREVLTLKQEAKMILMGILE